MRLNRTFNNCFVLALCLTLFPVMAEAQGGNTINLPNFVFPEFMDGIVELKTGDSYDAVINYEMLEQHMIVLKDGQYFVMKDENLTDTVIIGDRRFIPVEKCYYEVLATGRVSLFFEHKCILESIGGVVPYDTRSTGGGLAGNTTNYGPGGLIELKIPENYKVVDQSEMWVRKEGVMYRISGRKQFMKLFKENEDELNRFTGQNKTDFRNLDDVVKLVHYINGLN